MLRPRFPPPLVSTSPQDTGLTLCSMTLHTFEGKNVLPRLRFCQTNDLWAPIWWNLLMLQNLWTQRFRFLKFATALCRFGSV